MYVLSTHIISKYIIWIYDIHLQYYLRGDLLWSAIQEPSFMHSCIESQYIICIICIISKNIICKYEYIYIYKWKYVYIYICRNDCVKACCGRRFRSLRSCIVSTYFIYIIYIISTNTIWKYVHIYMYRSVCVETCFGRRSIHTYVYILIYIHISIYTYEYKYTHKNVYIRECVYVRGDLFWSAIHEPWFMPLAVFCTTSTHSLIFKRAVIEK